MNRLLHTGDIGDLVASLPILRALGIGDVVISEDKTGLPGMHPRESMRGARFAAIQPLLAAQDYVSGVEWADLPTGITHDLTAFRTLRILKGENLAQWQARYLGVEVNLDPWLIVPKIVHRGHVIVARSLRYHNFFFPWDDLLYKYRDRDIVFVGLPEERTALEKVAHRKVDYTRTSDLLELAELIAGAELMICNQSCPFWIAAGLGVPLIQETWETDPNSIIPRANAIYTASPPETRTLMLKLKKNEEALT